MGAGAILGGFIGAQLVIYKDARWVKNCFHFINGYQCRFSIL